MAGATPLVAAPMRWPSIVPRTLAGPETSCGRRSRWSPAIPLRLCGSARGGCGCPGEVLEGAGRDVQKVEVRSRWVNDAT